MSCKPDLWLCGINKVSKIVGGIMEDKKELFDWFFERTFTADEVKMLIERVKEFNAGCIDQHLSNHVDKVFITWLEELK